MDLTHTTPDRVHSAISWAKNNLISPEQYEPRRGSPLGQIVAQVYPAYQKQLLDSGAVDFDDLLLHVANLLRENPEIRRQLDQRYRYILVDEYQDTNLAQYTIVRAMSVDHPNLAVTGDPDQSIYGWRGANLNNILDFEHDYPNVKIVRLEQNYRSTKRILRVADQLISFNKRRKAKGLFTDNAEGKPVRLVFHPSQKDEAEQIAANIETEVRAGRRRPRDFAVFYRTNALSRSLEFALREFSIPYQMVNGLEFYQRKEIKDVLAYLHLLNNPRDSVAFTRIINTPPRGIGRGTIRELQDYADSRGTSLLGAAREAGLIDGLNKRAAVAVAKFVSMFDHLSLVATAPVEEIIGRVLAESGYHEFLKQSEDEDDQERLANIEELLTAAREFDETHRGQRRPGSVSGTGGPGERHRCLGSGRRPGDVDDGPRRQGVGISRRVYDRVGRGHFSARTQPQRRRATGRRTPPAVCGHHAGEGRIALEPRVLPALSRSISADRAQRVSDGIAAGRTGFPTAADVGADPDAADGFRRRFDGRRHRRFRLRR